MTMTGRSLVPILKSEKSGQVDPLRTAVLVGREREDLGRPDDVGYPVRGIRTREYLYTHNFVPDRVAGWESWRTGFPDIDESPSKTLIGKMAEQGQRKYFDLAMAKGGEEELYDLAKDPGCVENVANVPQYQKIKQSLWGELQKELTEQQDPRILGKGRCVRTL